jgi:hypothetical protein
MVMILCLWAMWCIRSELKGQDLVTSLSIVKYAKYNLSHIVIVQLHALTNATKRPI